MYQKFVTRMARSVCLINSCSVGKDDPLPERQGASSVGIVSIPSHLRCEPIVRKLCEHPVCNPVGCHGRQSISGEPDAQEILVSRQIAERQSLIDDQLAQFP